MQFNDIMDLITKTAEDHGWGDGPSDFPRAVALIHSEVSEAFEHYREGQEITEVFYHGIDAKPDGVPIELADIIIRVMHVARYWGIDLEEAILRKNRYNQDRPFKHGNKVC